MKDAEWEKRKKQVKAIFDKWIKHLGLGWYQIDLNWKAGDAPERGDGYIVAMNVVSRWMYRTAVEGLARAFLWTVEGIKQKKL